MSKATIQYACSNCGHTQPKWVGRCPTCKEYNTMSEEARPMQAGTRVSPMGVGSSGIRRTSATLQPFHLDSTIPLPPRQSTGHPELDRVLGGGLVRGSVTLISGDPGIGKSTLLLQTADAMQIHNPVVYITAEESLDQIHLRARRLGVKNHDLLLIQSNDALAIADYVETLPAGAVAIIDSIQALDAGQESHPGSTSQVKTAAAHLIPAAKSHDVSLIIVCQVTKEGTMAGPKILEHAVDTTLHIETDNSAGLYRIARTTKNRFGPVDEVGVFEMTDTGMTDVPNPSEIFLAQRDPTAFGTVIFPSLEGTRPLMIEVQALVSPTVFGTGRRSVNGWDSGRLNMLLAIMSSRLAIPLADQDVYVNVAGGLKIADPAMDLAVAIAILSARTQITLQPDLAVFGEIGLAGEVRNSHRADARIKEAAQLGLAKIVCPKLSTKLRLPSSIRCHTVNRIGDILTFDPAIKDAFFDGNRGSQAAA